VCVLKAGVVGAGVFGGFHARKYTELDGVELAGVYDPHPERARALADTCGGLVFDSLETLLEEAHLISVTSPAETHVSIGQRAVDFSRHLYLEKPLAKDVAEGQALVQRARDAGVTLAAGHQERAVFAAMGLLDTPEAPVRLSSVRHGTPNTRNRDVSCVLDLMIHDLDLALQLAGDEVLDVRAEGVFDAVTAEVVFRGGLHARFDASRQAEQRHRTMELTYSGGDVRVDFLKPNFENETAFLLDAAFASTPAGRDPLGASIGRFVDTVRGVADRPLANGEEGLAALLLAQRIEQVAGLVAPG
jgi:predicted dehydrogenase